MTCLSLEFSIPKKGLDKLLFRPRFLAKGLSNNTPFSSNNHIPWIRDASAKCREIVYPSCILRATNASTSAVQLHSFSSVNLRR